MATKKLPAPGLKLGAKKAARFNDCMTDLETLDTAVTAAILSIGACKFNETDIHNDGFYRAITLQSNLDEGRTISPDTLLWWLGQTDKAKAVLTDPMAIPLGQALDEFRDWVGDDWENIRQWGNGADFDLSIIKHAYGSQLPPWKFWNTRCFRTVKAMDSAKSIVAPKNAGAHNALFDAVAQAQHLQLIWNSGVGK